MSGIEAVGILLGSFSLCISALEHYERSRRVAGTFLDIRRAHQKDMHEIKHCRLMFQMNLNDVLGPLLKDEVVGQAQYEELLAYPDGHAWSDYDVDRALFNRLGEYHESFIERLRGIQQTMKELCRASRVNDPMFQEQVIQRQQQLGQTSSRAQQAQSKLLLEANHYVCFQAKRVSYAFTGVRRDALLAKLEFHLNKLQEILKASDVVSCTGSNRSKIQGRSVSGRALGYWRHAGNIYELLEAVWRCTCRRCVSLWLQHVPTGSVNMNFIMPFCHGEKAIDVSLSDKPPALQLQKLQVTATSIVSTGQHGRARSILKRKRPVVATTGTSSPQPSAPLIAAVTPSVQSAATARHSSDMSGHTILSTDGLCKALSTIGRPSHCAGSVSHGGNEYDIYYVEEKFEVRQQISLAEMLEPNTQLQLTWVQRCRTALALATSHLQLHLTPWLQEYWTAGNIYFPVVRTNNSAALYERPFIVAKVDVTNASTAVRKDRSFSSLGIVLLELCFGYRLEDHHLWHNPLYAALKQDPMMRHTVACEWLEEVNGAGGEDYYNAVDWTLRRAPAVTKDNKWREEFAAKVVSPLQSNYEYLHPPP